MDKLKEFWAEYNSDFSDFADLLVWVFGIWTGYNNPLQTLGVVVAILAVKTLWNK